MSKQILNRQWGFLMVEPATSTQLGGWTTFAPSLLHTWGFSPERLQAGGNPIAMCELAMVPMALLQLGPHIKGAHVLWFIDNSSSLHSLVKGSARDWYMDKAVALTHLNAAWCNLSTHFEYVDSSAIWADSISRNTDLDPFAMEHGFVLAEVRFPVELWSTPYTKLAEAVKKALGIDDEEYVG